MPARVISPVDRADTCSRTTSQSRTDGNSPQAAYNGIRRPTWSPDGRNDRLQQQPRSRARRKLPQPICGLSPPTTPIGAAALIRPRTTNASRARPPGVPTGGPIAFLSAADGVYGMPQLAVIPAAGGTARILSCRSRSLDQFVQVLTRRWVDLPVVREPGWHQPRAHPVARRQTREVLQGEQVVPISTSPAPACLRPASST